MKRGYAYIIVDLRGTGAAEGSWQAFSQIDQDDIGELLEYIKVQPCSNGSIGMNGASYMGITGLLAGAQEDPAVKAIFAIVPMGDAYRDIVITGGQVNAGFIPLWVTLVTGLGIIPTPAGLDNGEPGYYLTTLLQHLQGALTEFQVPVVAGALIGDENKYDPEFWRIRSPLEQIDKITAPTFVVGGLNDIFQRGEPLIYEGLKDHTTAKLLIGPWEHLDGSSGAGVPADGAATLRLLELALCCAVQRDDRERHVCAIMALPEDVQRRAGEAAAKKKKYTRRGSLLAPEALGFTRTEAPPPRAGDRRAPPRARATFRHTHPSRSSDRPSTRVTSTCLKPC